MSVYVDDMFAPYGRMKMCHMIADSREELDAMADAIGVQRKWIQAEGTPREHYVVSKQAREKAIAAGATAITLREFAAITRARRSTGGHQR